jgi:hypothetical protein
LLSSQIFLISRAKLYLVFFSASMLERLMIK